MPQLTAPVTAAGLEVAVSIGLDGKTMAAPQAAGSSIPPPVWARALLDTASDVTSVAAWVLQHLAQLPATTAATHTASGAVAVNLYEVSFSLVAPRQTRGPMFVQPSLLVSELSTVLPDADVLVGLDILLQTRFLLDGPAGLFTLDF
jgi:hypothetical protein